jgi:CMP-N-acetylneuraminic acid synthetase
MDIPLYHYIINTLLLCPRIHQVVVNTDSPLIMEGLRSDFPGVTVIHRPEHLRSGMVPMNSILLYDTSRVVADFYLQTHSTNPLLRPETISHAIETFLEQYPKYDSLFSVTRLQTRLYDQYGGAINHNPGELQRTQDLPPIYEENSCIYLFTRGILETSGHRIGERALMYKIDPEEAWDIDEELGFATVEFLMRLRSRVK